MNEKLSALVDGELDEEAGQVLDRLNTDENLLRQWEDFHLIGDVMRDVRIQPSASFSSKVMARLEQEPTVLAPVRSTARKGLRPLLSIAASVAGVLMVGWVVSTMMVGTSELEPMPKVGVNGNKPIVAGIPYPFDVPKPVGTEPVDSGSIVSAQEYGSSPGIVSANVLPDDGDNVPRYNVPAQDPPEYAMQSTKRENVPDNLFKYMLNHQSIRGGVIPDSIQYSRAVSQSLQE